MERQDWGFCPTIKTNESKFIPLSTESIPAFISRKMLEIMKASEIETQEQPLVVLEADTEQNYASEVPLPAAV